MTTLIRIVAYAYLAAGIAGILAPWIAWLLIPVIVAILVFASWNEFRQPISVRRWLLVELAATLGVMRLLFGPSVPGGSGSVSI